MQPPMSLPDDHFKKPYLPQQQYMNHGPLLPSSPLFSTLLLHFQVCGRNDGMAVANLMTCYIPQANHQPII